MDREILQNKAVSSLKKYKRLMCQWATGVGKSNVALKFLREHPNIKCLIVVPEHNNIENWKHEFRKFNVQYDNVKIICYASLHKYAHTSWGLLVFDEVPHLNSEKRKQICSTIKSEYILAFGAVLNNEVIYLLESLYGKFEKSYISIEKAIKSYILPTPRINICHISLDNLVENFTWHGRVLSAKEMYNVINDAVLDAVSIYNNKPSFQNKRKMLRLGMKRKRFLGSIKENIVKTICNKLNKDGKRFLCFCSSVEQAHRIGNDNAFTSKTDKSKHVLEKFNCKEINSIYAVGKLIEGQNLVDIEDGIITQLGSTPRITIQSIGRIMRSENPTIWIPVFDNTKDDTFIQTVTSSIPSKYILHYKF